MASKTAENGAGTTTGVQVKFTSRGDLVLSKYMDADRNDMNSIVSALIQAHDILSQSFKSYSSPTRDAHRITKKRKTDMEQQEDDPMGDVEI